MAEPIEYFYSTQSIYAYFGAARIAIIARQAGREAGARNVPGSPTYVVGGDMFYGQDRLMMVERALARPFAPPDPRPPGSSAPFPRG